MPNVYSNILPILTLLLCISCSSDPSGPVSMSTDADIESDSGIQDEIDASVLVDMEAITPVMRVDAVCLPVA